MPCDQINSFLFTQLQEFILKYTSAHSFWRTFFNQGRLSYHLKTHFLPIHLKLLPLQGLFHSPFNKDFLTLFTESVPRSISNPIFGPFVLVSLTLLEFVSHGTLEPIYLRHFNHVFVVALFRVTSVLFSQAISMSPTRPYTWSSPLPPDAEGSSGSSVVPALVCHKQALHFCPGARKLVRLRRLIR